MKTLRKMIGRHMQIISLSIVAVTLIVIVVIQFLSEQRWARESAERTFYQMEQVLADNQKNLDGLEQEYSRTCLYNAETIAYILENNPAVLESVDELKHIAEFVEVDEIHIFDEKGCIIAGTHPEYFGLTIDAGEQIGFFKPLLKDKSLKLVQEITPNTAEARLMQYSALWSEGGEFIVQVGMEPVSVMKVTEKNELSYIFTMFRANADAGYYAISADNGEIVGATDPSVVGKHLTEIGLNMHEVCTDADGFHADISGTTSFCVFKQSGENYIGRVISNKALYGRIPINTLGVALCLFVVAIVLSYSVAGYMNRFVVGGIHDINRKLRVIGMGELEERVEVQTSAEFSELSEHINDMVNSLMENNHKMSHILSKTNLYLGIYEYHEQSKKVRFTEYIPKILRLNESEAAAVASDYRVLRDFLEKVRRNPLQDEPGVYILEDSDVHYVRLEEIAENNQVFGVAIDVTEEMTKLKKAKVERDIDTLTGLYNRRGLESQLEDLFKTPKALGCSAIIMLDADGLKEINDKYGHEKGDVYLKKIAGVINNFGIKSSLASRQGGDEFVLFLYEYDDEKELLNTIRTLEYIQNNSSAKLDENVSVPLKFSIGYCMVEDETDYMKILKVADERMYENKRQRKLAAKR